MTDCIAELEKWSETKNLESHMCRICLTLTDLLVPIFEGEGAEQELEAKVGKYLPVQITKSDSLPLQLCFQCADTLIAWDSLITVCLETDKKLKALVGLTNTETEDCQDIMDSREHDSDDEPLVPPKKRKLPELKSNSNGKDSSSSSLSKASKSRRKKCVPQKLKKEKGDEASPAKKRKAEETDAQTEENSENNSDVANETNCADSAELLAVIKTEICDSDDGETNNVEDSEGAKEGGAVKCDLCSKTYKDRKYLSRHLKKVHEESKPFEAQRCEMCGNVYKTRANLERHYTKEHLSNQVECPVCHVSINSKKMDAHLKSLHGVKTKQENGERFKCKFCDKWFRNKYVRNSHVKEVHLSEPMKCKLCDFEGVRAVLRRHKRDVHAEKRFPCSLCHGAFKTLHTLKMHMTAHSDLRCYTCDICGMGFKRLNNVRDHMKCHEQKSNQCQICGNFFARKRYLAIHEKTIHNFYADGVIPEEKGFECGTCGAKLKWKKNLLAHMRIHTGEKPYVCKICKKDFICHGSLRTHMAKHGVCGGADVVSSVAEGIQETSAHLAIEMNVFNHFNPSQV